MLYSHFGHIQQNRRVFHFIRKSIFGVFWVIISDDAHISSKFMCIFGVPLIFLLGVRLAVINTLYIFPKNCSHHMCYSYMLLVLFVARLHCIIRWRLVVILLYFTLSVFLCSYIPLSLPLVLIHHLFISFSSCVLWWRRWWKICTIWVRHIFEWNLYLWFGPILPLQWRHNIIQVMFIYSIWHATMHLENVDDGSTRANRCLLRWEHYIYIGLLALNKSSF